MNQKKIQGHQLYNQIHLWNDPTVLVTGSCGDEYFMRGPHTAAQCLKYHGYNLLEATKESDYMYKFFNRKSCTDAIHDGMNSIKPNQSMEDVYTEILNRNKNDYQHWHLDNTITFTPFKNTAIIETILQSSVNQLLSNARNGIIQKKLIEKKDRNKLEFKSKWKNDLWDENSLQKFYRARDQLLNQKTTG